MKDWLKIAIEENERFNNSELGKLSDGKVKQMEAGRLNGLKNAKSGLLKKISKIGASKGGKNSHSNLNSKQTFETRSKAHKKQIPKNKVKEAIDKFIFNKDRAEYLGIHQITFRKLAKEYGLYKNEAAHEKFMKYLSDDERSKLLNKNKNKK